MSSYPAKISPSIRPIADVRSLRPSRARQLQQSTPTALIHRLEMIARFCKVDPKFMPEGFFPISLLMYNFELDRYGVLLRQLAAEEPSPERRIATVFVGDIGLIVSRLRTMEKTRSVKPFSLDQINEAVQMESGREEPTAKTDNLFTAAQYLGRLRSLSRMLSYSFDHALAERIVPIQVLFQHGRNFRCIQPTQALDNMLAQLPNPTERTEYILINHRYLGLLMKELEKLPQREKREKFGLEKLRELNVRVQEKFRLPEFPRF